MTKLQSTRLTSDESTDPRVFYFCARNRAILPVLWRTPLLEMVLADEGYRVLLAGNGRQGLERLAEGPRPGLVISDYMMPHPEGPSYLCILPGRPRHLVG
jgi:hypothetical protein